MDLSEKNSIEIQHLKEMIGALNNSMTFQFTIFWAIIGVVIAALGIALVIMIRKWVEYRVDNEVKEFKRELRMFESHWHNPVLVAGWISDDFETLSYMKDYFEVVHLRGAIRGGINNPPWIMFPKGYRPSQIHTFSVVSGEYPNYRLGTITIKPSGEIIINATSNDVVYLNGISFQAASNI